MIGERIKNKRLELGLTQEELAKKMGYTSRSTVNKVELGKNDITQSKVVEYAKALNTTVAYLMGWDEDEHDQVTIMAQQITDGKSNRQIDKLLPRLLNLTEDEIEVVEAVLDLIETRKK